MRKLATLIAVAGLLVASCSSAAPDTSAPDTTAPAPTTTAPAPTTSAPDTTTTTEAPAATTTTVPATTTTEAPEETTTTVQTPPDTHPTNPQLADLRAMLGQIFGSGYSLTLGPDNMTLSWDSTQPFTVVAEEVTAGDVYTKTIEDFALFSDVMMQGATAGVSRDFVFASINDIFDQAQRAQQRAGAENFLSMTLSSEMLAQIPGFPGSAFVEVGDTVVSFTLNVTPAEVTIDGSGEILAYASISPDGKVKFSYALWNLAYQNLLDYWADLP